MELNPMLHIDALHFTYGPAPLFQQLTLTLGPGINWLRGDNGAGKTTLLKLVAGILPPHAGQIRLATLEVGADALAYRRQTYYCGGDTPALPWLTVREILALHGALYPGSDAALLQRELAAFHLLAALDQPVTTLSLGQHKKMQLALALALPVTLLLIDEPFNGLDAGAVAYLRQQLADPQRLARQCVVLTSHQEPGVALAATVQL